MTTGMNRLAAAMDGRPSDRIPVFCNLLDQGASELGLSIREYYSKGEHVAEAHLRMREKYGYDNVWSLFYVGKEAELFGCKEILFPNDGVPNVADYVVKDYDDVHRLEVPDDLMSHPAFAQQRACFRILRSEVGGKYPICAYATAPLSLPTMLMGMDRWMELLLLGPESVRDELLAKCHEFFVKEVRAYRDLGADIVLYVNPFGSTDIMPRKFVERFSLPSIEKDIEAVGTSGIVFMGATSRIGNVASLVLERTGISAYYLGPLDDIAEAKKALAGRALTVGAINDIGLIRWTPQETRAEVERIISAGMPGGRFMFGTAIMPVAIPEENIHAMLEAAYEFGSYATELV